MVVVGATVVVVEVVVEVVGGVVGDVGSMVVEVPNTAGVSVVVTACTSSAPGLLVAVVTVSLGT